MAKYNLNSKSDMQRFENDMKNQIAEKARAAAMGKNYDIHCPHCKAAVSVRPGKTPCPKCRKIIELNLDFKF